MFLTKETLADDNLKAIIEEALLDINARFAEKIGDKAPQKPVRLSLSLSANGVDRVNTAICMCPDEHGRFVPTKCKPGSGCP